MADRFGLGETREADGTGSLQLSQPPCMLRHFVEIDAGGLAGVDLEDQRLFEHQGTVAGDRLSFALCIGGSRRPPAGRIDGHWTNSFSATSSASMSWSVTVSVTAMTNPFSSSSAPG